MKLKQLKTQLAGRLCLAVLLAGIASGCGGKTGAGDGQNAAQAAARTWLSLIDQGGYAESWKTAAPFFQGAVTEAGWEAAMTRFRQPLGGVLSRNLQSTQLLLKMPGAPDGRYMVMQFAASFANKNAAIETVTVGPETNGQWPASGYYIK